MNLKFLDKAPILVMLINSQVRVDYINDTSLQQFQLDRDHVIGGLIGRAINCINSYTAAGCGSSENCKTCSIRTSVEETFQTGIDFFKKEGILTLLKENEFSLYHLSISTNRVSIDGVYKVLLFIDDITELKSLMIKTEKLSFLYQKLFNEMSLGFVVHEIICDDLGTPIDYSYLQVNPIFEKLTGLNKEEILGKSIKEVLPNIEDSWIQRCGETALTGVTFEFQCYSRSLNRHYNAKTYSIGEGKFAVLFTDVTEYKILTDQLEYMAMNDELTSLENRRSFNLLIEMEMARAVRDEQPISMILIDVDHFKDYNDKYGHFAGDECLKTIAAKLKSSVKRKTDHVCRYGGEEFVILLPNTEVDVAKRLANKMLKAVESSKIEHKVSRTSDYVTVSAGIACIYPIKNQSSKMLIEMSDSALYAAKDAGRNNFKVYNFDSD